MAWRFAAHDSPWTNPWSMLGSLAVHGTILAAAAGVVLVRHQGEGSVGPGILRAELQAIDNRVPNEEPGGSPGELSTNSTRPESPVPFEPAAERIESPSFDAVHVEPGNDAGEPVVSESERSDTSPGGGGSGGGRGAGIGPGHGPTAEFFGATETATSLIYVIDRSGSMTQHGAWDLARRELIASLERLAPNAWYAVLVYNLETTAIAGATPREPLLAANRSNIEATREALDALPAMGGTDHIDALRRAFRTDAEVIFFLTDARQMTPDDAERLIAESGGRRIHAILFGVGPDTSRPDPIERLATATGGAYRYVDVLQVVRPR